ncbi:hypothetical protein EVAR_52853_1 [Eumeta japonica]|uniref:Uncharacterized protein n=1 Tax=Eumeta variegata TaxID=151549 RepID=A0A4C1YFV1_EUMVA|nr:hypothetical protein EVAR_52853_1 [Eumeta japonica]
MTSLMDTSDSDIEDEDDIPCVWCVVSEPCLDSGASRPDGDNGHSPIPVDVATHYSKASVQEKREFRWFTPPSVAHQLHRPILSSVRYLIPTREANNAPLTPLGLPVSMGARHGSIEHVPRFSPTASGVVSGRPTVKYIRHRSRESAAGRPAPLHERSSTRVGLVPPALAERAHPDTFRKLRHYGVKGLSLEFLESDVSGRVQC